MVWIDLADYFDVLAVAVALGNSRSKGAVEAYLVDETKAGSRNLKRNPAVLLYIVELLGEEVGIESALGTTLRVRNIVANHGFLTGDLTDLRHIAMFLLLLLIYVIPNRGANLGHKVLTAKLFD